MIPVIELYNFKIEGYNSSGKNIEFGNIKETKKNECKLINPKYPIQDDSSYITSCDVIYSEQITGEQDGGYSNILSIINLYKKYKSYPAKLNNNSLNSIFNDYKDEELIDHVYNEISLTKKNMYEYLENNSIDRDNNILNKLKENLNSNEDIVELNFGGYIMNYDCDDQEKNIIFGDFHGSFHTFYRHLLRFHRMGILNARTYELKENYNLIFLGDIADRGFYALEIIYTICRLMNANNSKNKLRVIYNRGNHEESVTNTNYGLKTEILKKTNNIGLFNLINSLFLFMSSAVIINNKNRYWLSHGGIPFLKDDDIKNIDWYQKIIFYESNKYSLGNLIFEIRWNDFANQKKEPYLNNRPSYNITPPYFKKFMKLSNIKFIIRGHQDNFSNFYLLSKLKDNDMLDYVYDLSYESNLDLLKNNNIFEKNNNTYEYSDKIKAFYGCLGRIKINNFIKNKLVYPIMTVSTNTDNGRELTSDSFIILRFDLDEKNINNFDNNIIDSRKKMLKLDFIQNGKGLNNIDNINYKNKYYKYKNKYLKLKLL
jgi:hypothetical protein